MSLIAAKRAPSPSNTNLDALSAPADVAHLVVNLVTALPRGRSRLALALLLAIAASSASVALMAVSAWLLSRAAELPPVLYLQVAAVGVRFFGIGRGVFRYLERLTGHDLALRMQGALRLMSYDKLSRGTLLGARRGDLLVRVTADVEAIMDVVVRVVLPFCSASVVILGTSTALAFFNPASAAVLLGCSIVAGIVFPWLAQRLSAQADAAAVPARGDLADQVHELSRCAPDLVAYGVQTDYLDALKATDEVLHHADQRAAWLRGLSAGGQLVATGIAVGAALVLGSHAVAAGNLLGRDLAVLCLTPLALHESFSDLTKAAQTLTRARVSLARIVDLLQSEPVGVGDRPMLATAADPIPADQPVVQLTDLDAGWPGAAPVLTGVTMRLNPGEHLALTGASGIGKTTLAATIMGLIPAMGGELQVTPRISYLAQDAHIFATTVSENVKIGNRDATAAQVRSALDRAGLQHVDANRILGEQGTTVSGGEARRLALARLLVTERLADLVILDEPTEHLDQFTATALMDDVWQTLGNTAILAITHDSDVVARCDREFSIDSHHPLQTETTG